MYEHSILLVDDEQSITRPLQRLFRKEKYHVLTASSGQEGLDILSTFDKPLSLIISDQLMPEMTGAQFLEKAIILTPDTISSFLEIQFVLLFNYLKTIRKATEFRLVAKMGQEYPTNMIHPVFDH